MPNVKNTKNPNPRGNVNAALGPLYKEVAAIAKEEQRAINRQIVVIVREWIAARKAKKVNVSTPRSAA